MDSNMDRQDNSVGTSRRIEDDATQTDQLSQESEFPEFIANIAIRDAPANGFTRVYGVENYIDLSPYIDRSSTPAQSYDSLNLTSGNPPVSIATEGDRYSTMSAAAKGGLNIVMFLGSVRENRNCDRVAKYVQTALQAKNHHVTILDPKEHNNLGQVVQPIHFYKNPADVPKEMTVINKQLQEADAFVVVAAEYNSGISPALCSLMDNFPPVSYQYRASAIVTYSMGQFGGIRSAMQLRQYMSELLTVHVPSMIVIPRVHEALNDQGVPVPAESTEALKLATDSTISQLEWYADALKKQRATVSLPK